MASTGGGTSGTVTSETGREGGGGRREKGWKTSRRIVGVQEVRLRLNVALSSP